MGYFSSIANMITLSPCFRCLLVICVSIGISCGYPNWSSLSFLLFRLVFFIKFGIFFSLNNGNSAIITLNTFFCSYGHGENTDLHPACVHAWTVGCSNVLPYVEKGNLHMWLRLSESKNSLTFEDYPRFSFLGWGQSWREMWPQKVVRLLLSISSEVTLYNWTHLSFNLSIISPSHPSLAPGTTI